MGRSYQPDIAFLQLTYHAGNKTPYRTIDERKEVFQWQHASYFNGVFSPRCLAGVNQYSTIATRRANLIGTMWRF